MPYCLNPSCPAAAAPGDGVFCRNCGVRLVLGDRFRALKPLGEGGFGRTLLAMDGTEEPPSYCVVKQLFPNRVGGLGGHSRVDLFQQEVDQLARLGQHPQIPQLLAHLEQDGYFYLVQEYIPGPNLEALLSNHGPFDGPQVQRALTDLLPVLQFIHDRHVIHRDVKPANIICPPGDLLAWMAGGDRLVLVDFGAAKSVTETALLKTGTVIGSAEYVAPEQSMGRAEFSSDLYSLGVTCVHLLTGLPPFDLYSVSEDAWVWQQYLPKPLPKPLVAILNKLLQKPTRLRYQTAQQVLRDLNALSDLNISGDLNGLNAKTRFARSPLGTWPLFSSKPQRNIRRSAPTRPSSPPAPLEPWQQVRSLVGHEGAITTIALSPKGRIIASGGLDRAILLWRLETGELLHTFPGQSFWQRQGHGDRLTGLAFTPDGKTLISSSDDGTVKCWDLPTLTLLDTLPGNGWGASALSLSHTGRLLAVGGNDGDITVWNVLSMAPVCTLSGHRDRVTDLILSPKGQRLISAGADHTIRLWDVKQGALLNTLVGHSNQVSAIAIRPDWRTLVSSSWDNTLRVWDMDSGRSLRTFTAHRGSIHALALDRQGSRLASGGEDGSIKLWDLAQTLGQAMLPEVRIATLSHTWGINALHFTPNGRTLVSGSSDATLKCWERIEEKVS